jgi:hypothetical protein
MHLRCLTCHHRCRNCIYWFWKQRCPQNCRWFQAISRFDENCQNWNARLLISQSRLVKTWRYGCCFLKPNFFCLARRKRSSCQWSLNLSRSWYRCSRLQRSKMEWFWIQSRRSICKGYPRIRIKINDIRIQKR